MISNPCKWPAKGKMKKDTHGYTQFTYKPGKHLYHFDASDSEGTGSHIPGWERYMGLNLVFFADDQQHAALIFEDMLRHRVKCGETNNYGNAQVILDNKNKWKFTLAPTNQFYKVQWADNDTFL